MPDFAILHTADLHIGRNLHGRALLDDQEFILRQIVAIAEREKVDAIVIAGDLFDRSVPAAEAVGLADWFFQECAGRLGLPTIVIAGNHDSPERLEFAAGLLGRQGLHIRGSFDPELRPIVVGNKSSPIEMYAIPYAEPSRINHELDSRGYEAAQNAGLSHQQAWDRIMAILQERWKAESGATRILVGHLFAAGGSPSDSERPLSIGGAEIVQGDTFRGFDIVLLGHLHRPQKIGNSVWYSGSPLSYGAAEADQQKNVLIVRIPNGRTAKANTAKNGELFDELARPAIRVENIPLAPKTPFRVLRDYFDVLLSSSSTDYVHVRLRDAFPVYDAFARLQKQYPNLLHIEREVTMHQNEPKDEGTRRRQALESGDIELVRTFLKDMGQSDPPEEWMRIVTEVLEEKRIADRESAQ